MKCSPEMLEALLDQELGAAEASAVQEHLESCPECSAAYARLRRLKAGIQASAPYYHAPPELRRSVHEALERASAEQKPRPARATPWRAIAIAASLLLAVSLLWNLMQLPRRGGSDLASAVLADHIRSLLGNSPVDVASSDQHTVKPWFAGKLEFSPPVKDLAAEGFPLVGGRVDYLADRRVAALVYRRRQHVITVFIWPRGSAAALTETSLSHNGFNLLRWTDGSMIFWAVSDVSTADLQTLRNLLSRSEPRP
jgi:anti-sigma factor RsiW